MNFTQPCYSFDQTVERFHSEGLSPGADGDVIKAEGELLSKTIASRMRFGDTYLISYHIQCWQLVAFGWLVGGSVPFPLKFRSSSSRQTTMRPRERRKDETEVEEEGESMWKIGDDYLVYFSQICCFKKVVIDEWTVQPTDGWTDGHTLIKYSWIIWL